MLTIIYTIAVVVFLFGLTVLVHEAGHFVAARTLGLVVDVFSIGFGPAVWKKKINGVAYKIGCIPFGGYVALPQLDPTGMALVQGPAEPAADGSPAAQPETPSRTLPRIAPWKKIIVSVAGAMGNFILAVIIAWVVFFVGKPATPQERSATVGFVAEDSPAYRAGLRIGDEVLAVNGEHVKSWVDFLMACVRYNNVALQVRSAGGPKTISLSTEKGVFGEQTIRGIDGRSLCMVLSVEPGMSADRAGLRRGDIIAEFDGREVISRALLIDLVAKREGKSVPIKIKRDGALLERTVTPQMDPATKQVRIGVQFNVMDVEFDEIVHPRPGLQLREHSMAIFRILSALTTPSQAKAASGALGGPVAILINYWFLVRASLILAVWFTGFLNVNLAILNLLPIPVLDGGNVVFALIEGAIRRPLSPRVVNWLTNVFASLLILVFILLTSRDLNRFTRLGRYARELLHRQKSIPAAVTNAVQIPPAGQEPAPAATGEARRAPP